MVACQEIGGSVVGDPDFATGVFGDEDFERESRAALGEASIRGVPALGLPKVTGLVFGIFRPALAASLLWSTMVKSFTPLASRMDFKRTTVSSTE